MKTLSMLATALIAGVIGCAPAGEGGPEGDTFIAFATHFKGFRSWESFPVTTGGGDPVHTGGPRTEYLKERPAEGADEFPVRTILVKETDTEALADRTVFAMVKRGGDYNASGATGWEWFELKNIDDQTVDIVWRGVGPPAGEKYGGDPNAGCNSCHEGARSNDFVLSTAIRLSDL